MVIKVYCVALCNLQIVKYYPVWSILSKVIAEIRVDFLLLIEAIDSCMYHNYAK